MRKLSLLVVLAVPAISLAQAVPQGSDASLTDSRVYSIWVARHAATVKLAEMGAARGTNGDVRKFAEKLAKEERETSERLQKEAARSKIQIASVGHDTTDAMLAAASAALSGKSGHDFDAEWANQAYVWLRTLVLDNNSNVSGKLPEGDLKKMAQAYSSFQFRLSVDARSVQVKVK